jgi:hypothetical protein
MTYPPRLRSPNFLLSRERLNHGYTRHTRRSRDVYAILQALVDFVHHYRLTEHMVSFVRALQLEVEPPIPLLSPDDPSLAAADRLI